MLHYNWSSFACSIISFWGLPHTSTGFLPLDPPGGHRFPRPADPEPPEPSKFKLVHAAVLS